MYGKRRGGSFVNVQVHLNILIEQSEKLIQ